MTAKYFCTALLLAAALGFSSCQKAETEDAFGGEIRLGAAIGSTRSMINGAEFEATAGSLLKVYDIYTSETGYTSVFIDNTIQSPADGGNWSYVNDRPYYWTRTGRHQFFGWLVEDGHDTALNASNLFGSGFGYSNGTVTIPRTDLRTSSRQFDFLYSDVLTRTPADADYTSSVDLSLKHLFAAYGFSLLNNTPSAITIKSLTVGGIRNCNGAEITYTTGDNAGVDVTYGTPSHTANSVMPSEVTLAANGGKVYDAFAPASGATANTYYLTWPQKSEYFEVPEGSYTIDEDGYYSDINLDAPLIVVTYEIDGVEVTNVAEFKKAGDNYLAWEAGKKIHYDIVFSEKGIDLVCVVKPWNQQVYDVDFSNEAASVAEHGSMKVNETTCTLSGTDCYTLDGLSAVEFTFRLASPIGGTIMISLEGDVANFTTSFLTSEIVTEGESTTFQIAPKGLGNPGEYRVKPHISVRMPDGRTINADDVLSSAGSPDYTVVYQKR